MVTLNGTLFLTSCAGFGTLFVEDEQTGFVMNMGKSVVREDVFPLFCILQIVSECVDLRVVSGTAQNCGGTCRVRNVGIAT